MGAESQLAALNSEFADSPVELLVAGCAPDVAYGFANALRNQGQATHLKTADSIGSLSQQLCADRCSLVIINAESDQVPLIEAVAKVRAANARTSIILVANDLVQVRPVAIEHGLQDLIDIDDQEHLAFAIRREHQTLLLHRRVAQLSRQLQEAEERSNLLVHSSRDAIAYIHEGMYLLSNQAYLDLFGYESADEIDGLPIMDMISADSRSAFKAALRKLAETDRLVEDFECINSEGQKFTAKMAFSSARIDGELCTQVMIRDQNQTLVLQQRIDELTSRDAQTGFFNRQAFMDRLEALIASPQRGTIDCSLIQLSITNYAQMREQCGFEFAEQMLTEVASLLSGNATDAHTIARFGDHDFMILYDALGSPAELAERCLKDLRNHSFHDARSSGMLPVFAIGITPVHGTPDAGPSAHELINRSCRATDSAKAEGENRVVLYDDDIGAGQPAELESADAALIAIIDDALANDGFRLKYQPIVSLQGDTRENYSVYLRLLDKAGTEVAPDAFLSPARDASRLAEVDRWVVRNAIRELASHRRAGKKIVFYIILSRAGIEDDSMLLWICDCLREFRTKGSWLVFQFRENDLRNASQPAKDLIDGLKKINCRIAINHYTDSDMAEAMLHDLAIDVVKLSPEFMRDLATDPEQHERMNLVNGKLQAAGFKTIASSVEDAGSLAVLWNIGVNYIQGYFLQEPSNAIVFEPDQEG